MSDSTSRYKKSAVTLEGLSKSYGSVKAIEGFSLEVAGGRFASILGPSGCGKTTILRLVAGFLAPDSGRVLIGGVDQGRLSPDKRALGLVFQDYALFPHLKVRDNLAYGLKAHRLGREEIREAVADIALTLDLGSLLERMPHELSGGQQQRVALGRALVLKPEVLLMDEPLSNLDAKLRARVREELKDLQASLGVTTLYVTHDQEEALALSDQVAIMKAGRLEQEGSPLALYREPQTLYAADFVGAANVAEATCLEVKDGLALCRALDSRLGVRFPIATPPKPGEVGHLVLRPEWLCLGAPGAPRAPDGPDLVLQGRIQAVDFLGGKVRYRISPAQGGKDWIVDEALGAQGQLKGLGEEVLVLAGPGQGWWLPSS